MSGDDAPVTTTTTEPEPELLPPGSVWVEIESDDIGDGELVVIDDEVWSLGARYNAPAVYRSTDGSTWELVDVMDPPTDGIATFEGLVRGPDGRYVGYGLHSTSCSATEPVGDGYLLTMGCDRQRPIIYLSDDGDTWRQVEPRGLTPPGRSSIRLAGVVVDPGGGYLAAGTMVGPDWFIRLWRSDDGERWEPAGDVRGADGTITATRLLAGGGEVVLLANEHPCSVSKRTPVGWAAGSVLWADHLRIFVGSGADDLTLQGPQDLPVAWEPMDLDCSSFGYDEFNALSREPYATVIAGVVGDTVTLLDTTTIRTDTEMGRRVLYRLASGGWVTDEIAGLRGGDDPTLFRGMIDVEGRVGIVEARSRSTGGKEISVILPQSSAGWIETDPVSVVVAEDVTGAAWIDGAVLASGKADREYVQVGMVPGVEYRSRIWRSVASFDPGAPVCDLGPGVRCDFLDFSTVPGYPDLTYLDLTGAELRYADLEAADLTGVSFDGAFLHDVEASGATLVGASFVGADLHGSWIRDVAGADFTDAALGGSWLEFSGPVASFDGAQLANVYLRVVQRSDGSWPDLEMSLAGMDLTRARITGPDEEGSYIRVTDMSGANLLGASLTSVDMTGAPTEGVDFRYVIVAESSICPDGEPPDPPDGPGCDRSG